MNMRPFYRLKFTAVALATLLLIPSVASAALIGLYTFEGTYDDVSGQNLDPSSTGVATLTTGTLGYEGEAASFAGVAGTAPIILPYDAGPDAQAALTIGAWVRSTDHTAGNQGVFSTDNSGWDRGLALSGGTWRVPDGANTNSGIAGVSNTWQFVAVRYSGVGGTTIRLDVDTNTFSYTGSGGANTDTQLKIGTYGGTNPWTFNGRIDNFFIFDEALSDTDITTIRTNGLAGIQSVAAIPEPTTFALLVLGVAGLLLRRRRA